MRKSEKIRTLCDVSDMLAEHWSILTGEWPMPPELPDDNVVLITPSSKKSIEKGVTLQDLFPLMINEAKQANEKFQSVIDALIDDEDKSVSPKVEQIKERWWKLQDRLEEVECDQLLDAYFCFLRGYILFKVHVLKDTEETAAFQTPRAHGRKSLIKFWRTRGEINASQFETITNQLVENGILLHKNTNNNKLNALFKSFLIGKGVSDVFEKNDCMQVGNCDRFLLFTDKLCEKLANLRAISVCNDKWQVTSKWIVSKNGREYQVSSLNTIRNRISTDEEEDSVVTGIVDKVALIIKGAMDS